MFIILKLAGKLLAHSNSLLFYMSDTPCLSNPMSSDGEQTFKITPQSQIDSKNLPECVLKNKMFSLVSWRSSTKVQRQGYCKLYKNQCLAKIDSLLTLKLLNNFFGRKINCCLPKSEIKISLGVKLAYRLPINLSFRFLRNYLTVRICKNSRKDTLLQYYQMLPSYLYKIQAVSALLQILDPDGVKQRKRDRKKTKIYC